MIPTSTQSSRRASLLILLAAAVIVLLACLFKITDRDFWWHLKTGQLILQQHSIPHKEVFSHTEPGREYVDHEWVFQILQYLAYSAGGPLGAILLKSAVFIAVYLLIVGFLVKEGVQARIILSLVLLSVAGGRIRFLERPESFSLLFVVCEYLLLEQYLRTGSRKFLVLIVPLFVIWANVHAAVVLGFLLLIAFVFGAMTEISLETNGYPVYHKCRYSDVGAMAALFVVCIAAALLNPNGARLFQVPFELTRIIESGVLDNFEWRQPPPTAVPFYYVCLVLVFAMKLKNCRNIHVINLLLAGFLGYISLKYIRNVGLFCAFTPLLIAPYFSGRDFPARKVNLALAASAAAFCLAILFSPLQPGVGEDTSWTPTRIVRFTKEKNLQGNMFNSYGFGGYLIWNLYPERKIFIDGRNEVFLPLLKTIHDAVADRRLWQSMLDRYSIDYALLNYEDTLEQVTIMRKGQAPAITYAPFSSNHFPRTTWALVYWDDTGMVWIKRNGRNTALLPMEYRAVYPEGRFYQEAMARTGRVNVDAAIAELKRKVGEDPGCRRARYLLARMLELKKG